MDTRNEIAQYEATAAKYQALADKYKEKVRETKIESYRQAIKNGTLELPYKITKGITYRESKEEADITDNMHAVASDLGIEDFDAILPTKEPTTNDQKKFVAGVMRVAMRKGDIEYKTASELSDNLIEVGLQALGLEANIVKDILEGLE